MRGSLAFLFAVGMLLVSIQVPVHAVPYPAPCSAPPGCVAGGSTVCGVLICGVCYNCGDNTDGVCPSNYQPGSTCGVMDNNCANPENSLATCTDAADNDLDTLTNYADYLGPSGTPSYAPGDSCSVCNQAACAAATGYNLPPYGAAPNNCQVSQPAATATTQYVSGTALRPGTAAALRLDCDNTASNCWCGVCAPGYTFSGATCVFNPPAITSFTAAPSASGPAPLSITGLTVQGTFSTAPHNTGPVTVEIDTDGVTATVEQSCAGLAASPFICNRAVALSYPSAGSYALNARVRDARGYTGAWTPLTITVSGSCTVVSFGSSAPQGSAPHSTTFTLSGSCAAAQSTFELDTNNDGTYDVSQVLPHPPSPNTWVHTVNNLPVGSHVFRARIRDGLGNQALAGPLVVDVVAGPQITQNSSLPATAVVGQPLTLTGAATFGAPAATLVVFNDVSNPSSNCTRQEIAPNTAVQNCPAVAPSVGMHQFSVRVNDSYGKVITAPIWVQANADAPPVVDWANNTTTSAFGSAVVSLNISITDDVNIASYVVNWGDGVSNSVVTSGTLVNSYNVLQHTYAVPSNPIITVTATDSALQTGSKQTPLTLTSLPCVSGTMAGNPTYSNNANECCTTPRDASTSCASPVAGWLNCFSVNACYPNDGFICGGANPLPPPSAGFVDRDTSQAACQQANPTCTAHTWVDHVDSTSLPLTGQCCGDDAGDNYVATIPNAPGEDACCSGANTCYSGIDGRGCRVQSVEICGDGADNDCSGAIDDGLCGSRIFGTITAVDPVAGTSNAVGAYVRVGAYNNTTDVNGYYEINGLFAPGTYTMYAGLLGYSVYVDSALALNYGSSTQKDIQLVPRQCNANCANSEGYCDTSCIGVGGCYPTAAELTTLYACHPAGQAFGLKEGTPVVIYKNASGVNETICCTDPVGVWRDTPVPKVEGPQKDLGRLTRTFGNGLRLVIITWYS